METISTVDPNTFAVSIGTTIQALILNNWTLGVTAMVALAAVKLFKAGVQLVLTLIVAGVVLSVLTNMGIIPPIDELIRALGCLLHG